MTLNPAFDADIARNIRSKNASPDAPKPSRIEDYAAQIAELARRPFRHNCGSPRTRHLHCAARYRRTRKEGQTPPGSRGTASSGGHVMTDATDHADALSMPLTSWIAGRIYARQGLYRHRPYQFRERRRDRPGDFERHLR